MTQRIPRVHSPEHVVVVNTPSKIIMKLVVGCTDLYEPRFSALVSRVVLGVVDYAQFPEGPLNLNLTGIGKYAQHLIISWLPIRVQSIKVISLKLVLEPILLEEPKEKVEGCVEGGPYEKLVVV